MDAPGVTHIFGRQTNDDRKCEGTIDQGNANYGIVGGECLTVLDNVFVPWEYVFMCGEYQFSGLLVERFACYHRSNYGGCKGGVSDVVIGAAALWADYQGTSKASHIKDKLNEMMHMTETLYAAPWRLPPWRPHPLRRLLRGSADGQRLQAQRHQAHL